MRLLAREYPRVDERGVTYGDPARMDFRSTRIENVNDALCNLKSYGDESYSRQRDSELRCRATTQVQTVPLTRPFITSIGTRDSGLSCPDEA